MCNSHLYLSYIEYYNCFKFLLNIINNIFKFRKKKIWLTNTLKIQIPPASTLSLGSMPVCTNKET